MMIHADPAAQPFIGDVLRAQVCQPSGTADAVNCGLQPQRQQNRGINRRPADAPCDRLNVSVVRTPIELLDEAPHHPPVIIPQHNLEESAG